MNMQKVYILEDRGILYINGADANEFLQNMISNDINKVNEDNSCFASLLTPQGKFLFAFIVVKHKSGYFIDCEKSQTEALFKQLSIYKLRAKVEIMNLSNEFVIAAFSHEKFLKFEGAKDIPGNTIKYREDPILLDPRNKDLGARLIINLEKLYLSLKKLELKDSPITEYYELSHELGIAQKEMNKKTQRQFNEIRSALPTQQIELLFKKQLEFEMKLDSMMGKINFIFDKLNTQKKSGFLW